MKSAYPNNMANNAANAQMYQDGTCETAQITEIDQFKNRLSDLHNFVCNNGDNVERLVGKLLGHGGNAGSDKPATPRPVPAGDIGQMNQIMDDIMERLHRTGDATLRLSRAI